MPDSPPITVEAMRALPRWARVAFAAKCGRRVQPLLRRLWVNPHLDALKAFEIVIALAEESAAGAASAEGLRKAVQSASKYASRITGPLKVRQFGQVPPPITGFDMMVCHAVAQAAVQAGECARFAGDEKDGASAAAALNAYGWAVHAATLINVRGTDVVLQFDFSYLADLAAREGLGDESPIPPDSFAWGKELATYERELPNLASDDGRFVAIRGDQVLGIWDTLEDALQAGYERYGLNAVLVKRIETVAEGSDGKQRSEPLCPTDKTR